MVTARGAYDAYDEWFEGYADPDEGFDLAPDARRLALVRPRETRVAVVTPQDYAAAQSVADRLREGALVVVDLREVDKPLAGRLTDFCSGLVYALDGSLQYLTEGVMLLTPTEAEISGDGDAGIRQPGFYNRL